MKETIVPIAYIRTDFDEKFGIPRQSLRVKGLRGKIVFLPEYRSRESLRDIEQFSYLWILFDFSKAHEKEGKNWTDTVRPPRLGGNRRVGVFASRSPYRPNHIGLSSVKLVSVEHDDQDGDVLIVEGADLLDMTPIYDIKPYITYSDSHPEAKSGYADEHKDHFLSIRIPDELLQIIPEEKRESLIGCLEDDPRPSYIDDPERIYGMSYAGYNVNFRVEDSVLTVTDIQKKS